MTMEQIYTLREVVREACCALPGASVYDTVSWIRRHRRKVVEENFETLSYQALAILVRAERKSRPPEVDDYSENLALDFGLTPVPLDREISVPKDLENPIAGGCDWRELEEATIRDLDAHILLLRATARATDLQAEHYNNLRQAAMRHNPNGNLNMTIRELRRIARGE
jgi:hypothetical protein